MQTANCANKFLANGVCGAAKPVIWLIDDARPITIIKIVRVRNTFSFVECHKITEKSRKVP
jgi:hypothetical protein